MVSDRFWLSQAKDMVSARSKAYSDAASKLVTATGWFWTAYTTLAIVGTALAGRSFPLWVAILLTVPALLLIMAYFSATLVLMPTNVTFDPRAPEDVRKAFDHATLAKQEQLSKAKRWVAAATIAVAGAIIVAATTPKDQESSFAANARPDGNETRIIVGGRFDAGQKVTITVVPKLEGTVKPTPIVTVSRANRDGTLQAAVPVESTAKTFDVTGEWTKSSIRQSMTETVKVE
jgi:hypothetical protein